MCDTCGSLFRRNVRWSERYCSPKCRTEGNTAMHGRYVSKNRQHVRQYAYSRRHGIWGKSNFEIGRQAEKLAFETILPRIGFTDLYDVTQVRTSIPFDFVATLRGERVLIDVTTCIGKSGRLQRSAASLANALRMKYYTLFVKPNLAAYALKLTPENRGVFCGVKDLIAIA
ncbi:MAG: hypothetical protein LYZ66_00810 [Nitrososphaerales archaeon]|nr:hypothetical protein [Nitrososphaerales archaeon]